MDGQLPLIPEGDLREAVGDVLGAYELASETWEQASRSKPSEEAGEVTNDALSTTWGNARKRLEQAGALLKRREARAPAPRLTARSAGGTRPTR